MPKIIGTTVATPAPQPDWNQTNPNRADFIKNKPDETTMSQGRSASYYFKTPGWKRILNIIRASNGTVDIGLCQGEPYRMVQALAFDVSGFVRYFYDSTTDKKPVLLKRYENVFGQDDALGQCPCKITKVRVGYPKWSKSFQDPDNIVSATNPVNCYLDVYVDFETEEQYLDSPEYFGYSFQSEENYCTVTNLRSELVEEDEFLNTFVVRLFATLSDGSSFTFEREGADGAIIGSSIEVGDTVHYFAHHPETGNSEVYIVKPVGGTKNFNMNYAGFADSHNCEAITEETPATDTGIYGETLEYYTVDVASMPYYLTDGNSQGVVSSSVKTTMFKHIYEGASGYGTKATLEFGETKGDFIGQIGFSTKTNWMVSNKDKAYLIYMYIGQDPTTGKHYWKAIG